MSAVTVQIDLIDGDGDSLGTVDQHTATRLTVVALKAFADAKRREAQSRTSSGPGLAEYRAGLRAEAGELGKFAEQLEREQLLITEAASAIAILPQASIDLTVDALFHHADTSRRNASSRKLTGEAYKRHRQAWRDRADLLGRLAVVLRDGTLYLATSPT